MLRGVIATVGVVSSAGVTLIFPGQTAATAKAYKRLDTGQALATGNTVLAVKVSGTYVIIGKLI